MTQLEYVSILFDDLGFNLATRKDWLEREYKCRYADELTTLTRSRLIDRLKQMKEAKACTHERLNEEGICRQCGEDRSGI